jgi:hypothetical protein
MNFPLFFPKWKKLCNRIHKTKKKKKKKLNVSRLIISIYVHIVRKELWWIKAGGRSEIDCAHFSEMADCRDLKLHTMLYYHS